MRKFDSKEFEKVFREYISKWEFQEFKGYYDRYKSRYKNIIKRFSKNSPDKPIKVLDIGGGQFSILCKQLYGDYVAVADIEPSQFELLNSMGVKTKVWNLYADEGDFESKFDVIFFSEVIEHIPVPGYILLNKLYSQLNEGGIVICSTPNLHRLRNIIFLILGKRIFDYFRYPDKSGLGHVLEYSKEHLSWQFSQSKFKSYTIELENFKHSPNSFIHRLGYYLLYPLSLLPTYKTDIVVIAKK